MAKRCVFLSILLALIMGFAAFDNQGGNSDDGDDTVSTIEQAIIS